MTASNPNPLEHQLAVHALKAMLIVSKTTAIGEEGLKRILAHTYLQFEKNNPKMGGTNRFSPEVVTGMLIKYHTMQFFEDNIRQYIDGLGGDDERG